MAIGSFDMRSIPAALRSNTLYALIAANVSVFVAVAVFGIFDGGRMLSWLVLPSLGAGGGGRARRGLR